MANDQPDKPEGKFSEVARKSREKRAAMKQQEPVRKDELDQAKLDQAKLDQARPIDPDE